ncbi:MAG TPA: HEXXH motif-containing putative peptide modification protein [Nitrospira sp.]|nr:HEXXH motif-containing putative peptide modification protein [Nitrospira sp.]
MSLLDTEALRRLQAEFRQSMRMLLTDLCQDIDGEYSDLADQLALPAAYFRFLVPLFAPESYANWKVVGWIEALNDLVYFLDLLQQIPRERDQRAFAEQLFAECEQKFFENSYLDELFPQGGAQARGLATRLHWLCMRLSREVTQESLFFDPRWAMQWKSRQGPSRWEVSGSLDHHFERAERACTLPVGTAGDELVAPEFVVKAAGQTTQRVIFEVNREEMALRKGRAFPICSLQGADVEWHWARRAAVEAAQTPYGSLTVGPTLRYGKDRQPKAVVPTNRKQVARIVRAWDTIQQAWPEGHALLELLTSRIIPLKAKGVVSFSYRHRPGLSFINCFDRDNLDLIDDLIHENSHHHLNLLLRKHVMYHGDRNQQIFYSPWRRSLRPIRGILHAAFTFTMGALLFERLSSWAETKKGLKRWKEAGLTPRDLMRARFRCLEEIESVRYSIQDLDYAGRHLKWITGSGARLVRQLEEEISKAEARIARHRKAVLNSSFGPALRRHIKELQQARQTYGPVRLIGA